VHKPGQGRNGDAKQYVKVKYSHKIQTNKPVLSSKVAKPE
jgi:hypothetical protein